MRLKTTTSTLVTTIVEKEHFFRSYYSLQRPELTSNTVSPFLLTLKSQAPVPDQINLFTSRNSAARFKKDFSDNLTSVAKQASQTVVFVSPWTHWPLGSTCGSQYCISKNHVDVEALDKRMALGVPVAYREKSTKSMITVSALSVCHALRNFCKIITGTLHPSKAIVLFVKPDLSVGHQVGATPDMMSAFYTGANKKC